MGGAPVVWGVSSRAAMAEAIQVGNKLYRFDEAGPAGLYGVARIGRPRKVTAAVRDILATLVTQDSALSGRLATLWTVAMLVLAVCKKKPGARLSRSMFPLRWRCWI